MANYDATARSNYFPFIQSQLDLIEELFPGDIQLSHKNGLVAVISLVSGTPQALIEDEAQVDLLLELGMPGDDIDDLSLLDVIHHALPPDTSLVWIETGHEKVRYLVGQAVRINHLGEVTQTVDLNSIYTEGETRAEY